MNRHHTEHKQHSHKRRNYTEPGSIERSQSNSERYSVSRPSEVQSIKINQYHDQEFQSYPFNVPKKAKSHLQEITQEQFTDLLRSHGIQQVHTQEHEERFLVPIKSEEGLKYSNKDSVVQNFNDYSRLQKIMGGSFSSFIRNQTKNKINDKLRGISLTSLTIKKQISSIKNQLKAQTLHFKEFIKKAQQSIILQFLKEYQKIKSTLQQQFLQLREKELLQMKWKSIYEEEKKQKLETQALNARIYLLEKQNKTLKEEISVISSKTQVEKDKERYLATLKKFSLEVEGLANQIYSMKQKEIEREEELKLWAQQLEQKQLNFQNQKERWENQNTFVHQRQFKIPPNYMQYEEQNQQYEASEQSMQYPQMTQIIPKIKYRESYQNAPYNKLEGSQTQFKSAHPLNFSHNGFQLAHKRFDSGFKQPQNRSIPKQSKFTKNNIKNLRIKVANSNEEDTIGEIKTQRKNVYEYSTRNKQASSPYQKYTQNRSFEGNRQLRNHTPMGLQLRRSFGVPLTDRDRKKYVDISSINNRLKMIQHSMNEDLHKLNFY